MSDGGLFKFKFHRFVFFYAHVCLCFASALYTYVRYCILNAFIQMSYETLCAFIYYCNIRLAEPLWRKNCFGKVQEKQFPPSQKETVYKKNGKMTKEIMFVSFECNVFVHAYK